ncbi:MAG: TetR/AcrR family transcriptional regulator [Prevotellaceae bacterium]|jgi:AcrR family transcriptional regulator|nr:TetR/AcrR family transcriptional regulator [Prevotellaceae bacterium]
MVIIFTENLKIMGIKKRKERERAEMRSLILSTAKKLLIERGYEQTSVRNIASEISYSHGTIYLYFRDKDAIFQEISKQGLNALTEKVKSLAALDNPIVRLVAMGRAYVDFVRENPDIYELMFTNKAFLGYIKEKYQQDRIESKQNVFHILLETMQECIDKKFIKSHYLESLSFLFWSTLHGAITLEISGRLYFANSRNPETSVDKAFDLLCKLVRS